MKITVQLAVQEDFLPLSRFFAKNNVCAVTRYFNPFPLNEATARQITQEPHRDKYYVARAGQAVVGLVMLRGWDEGYEIPSFGILIDPVFHNQGLGKQLTQFALAEAKNLGCRKIRLSVYASNAQALRVFTSLGFKETSRAGVLVNGEPDAKIIMEQGLEP